MIYKATKIHLLLLLLLSFIPKSNAQLTNEVFYQKDTLIPNDTQTVALHFESLNYLRNTEYFDIMESGQTYFGIMLQLHLTYQPYKNVLVKAGLQTRQDFGSNDIRSVAPVFSVSIFKDRWRHNFGMLQGSTNLGLIEPMFNIDRAITNRIENGIQSIYRHKGDYYCSWLMWDLPTYRTTMNQEQFNTGIVWNKNLLTRKKIIVEFPLQGTLAHRGGQVNTNPTPIYTRINLATGIKIKYLFSNTVSLRAEQYYLRSDDYSPRITQPYKNGNASWSTLALKVKNLEFMLNYWVGSEWQSPIGTHIYNNYNFYDIYEQRRVRHMLFTRGFYTQKLHPKLFLDLRFEPFYDFEYKGIQYSYSVYLKLNIDKVLGKI